MQKIGNVIYRSVLLINTTISALVLLHCSPTPLFESFYFDTSFRGILGLSVSLVFA